MWESETGASECGNYAKMVCAKVWGICSCKGFWGDLDGGRWCNQQDLVNAGCGCVGVVCELGVGLGAVQERPDVWVVQKLAMLPVMRGLGAYSVSRGAGGIPVAGRQASPVLRQWASQPINRNALHQAGPHLNRS